MKVYLAGIERHSFVNGPGTRYVIFFQGCPHHCPGCQNPETWEEKKGTVYQTEDIISDILSTKFLDGVTFSGGDPLFQADSAYEIAKILHEKGISVWCYTGWTYEAVLAGTVSASASDLLDVIDVLVDGPFLLSLRSDTCLYRGSSNQRIIDVKKSKEEKAVVLLNEFDYHL